MLTVGNKDKILIDIPCLLLPNHIITVPFIILLTVRVAEVSKKKVF